MKGWEEAWGQRTTKKAIIIHFVFVRDRHVLHLHQGTIFGQHSNSASSSSSGAMVWVFRNFWAIQLHFYGELLLTWKIMILCEIIEKILVLGRKIGSKHKVNVIPPPKTVIPLINHTHPEVAHQGR